jgi:hypothetical protein
MAFEAILDEVDQLHNVSTRLEGLGEPTTPVIATKKKRDFDPKRFLATIGGGRRIVPIAKKQTIYAQGAACDAVFYICGASVGNGESVPPVRDNGGNV